MRFVMEIKNKFKLKYLFKNIYFIAIYWLLSSFDYIYYININNITNLIKLFTKNKPYCYL